MQALWLAFSDIAGKGIGLDFILKFIYYTALMVSPQALPIAVLLSAIMALGNLSESYEFAAVKSAGISFQRVIRPLVVFTLLLSGLNFFFLNNVFPYATLKQKNLAYNIKTKEPSLALVPGMFNTEIPNYQIKFDEKYGEDKNLLKNVLIYDLSSRQGNQKIITAERGKIVSETGSKYMTLILYNGYYYENHKSRRGRVGRNDNMPASQAKFKEYTFNIDISSLTDESELEKIRSKSSSIMLSLGQLKDTIPQVKEKFDQFLEIRSRSLYRSVNAEKLYAVNDSIKTPNLQPNIIDNFNSSEKVQVLTNAISKAGRAASASKTNTKTFKIKRKFLNLYDVEFYNRIAFSFACLILFFIGAPLGSIIRKGGFGISMIMAITIYVIYFFSNTLFKNLAEESSISAILGAWLSAFIMIPFCILFTRRAIKGMGLFNIDVLLQSFTSIFKRSKKNADEVSS